MSLKFSKMHGLGNDFVIIDAINQSVNLNKSEIRQLADRHTGIGADEIILIEPPPPTNTHGVDFIYRIFNPDGVEVGQCGNGARCASKFIYTHKLTTSKQFKLQTKIPKTDGSANVLNAAIQDDGEVSVDMGTPVFAPSKIPFQTSKEVLRYKTILKTGEIVEFGAAALGNPHAVIQVANVDRAPVEEVGKSFMQNHTLFPEEVNVGFMQVVAPDYIKLRVYERGVGETLACGSGACAAVAIGNLWNILEPKVVVEFTIGKLTIFWPGVEQNMVMTGPAEAVFEGILKT